jgi:MYXO-CTERM domain-containing protein
MAETRFRGSFGLACGVLSLGVFSSTSGCSSVSEDEPGTWRGRFVENVARFESGKSEVTYTLYQGRGRSNRRTLVFDEAPELLSNTEIEIWGTEVDGRIDVERFEVKSEQPPNGALLGKSREALIDAAPIEPTNLVMVLVDTGAGLGDVTIESSNAELFADDPTSLKNYYTENSYGMHSLTGQVAPGTYNFTWTGCNYDDLVDALVDQVHTDTGVPEFDLYLWYFPRNPDCSWSGLSSGQDTFYSGSQGCVVLAQEPGHSFGLSHSSSLHCRDAAGNVVPFVDDPNNADTTDDVAEDDNPGPNQCLHDEYGNDYDSMGGGCRHFSGYQKVYRTYLQGCNVAQVLASGTFTLHPIETACNGIQVLQVPMPKVRPIASEGGGSSDRTTELAYYNVELRAPIGAFDGSTNSPMVPSVLVNAAPDWRVFGQGGGGRGRGNTRGEHIWLLDMAPASTGAGGGSGRGGGGRPNGSGHALAVGQTYTDPAGGVSITTEAVSATSATIRVELAPGVMPAVGGAGGAPPTPPPGTVATCLDDMPLLAPGPASCDGSYAGMGGMAGAGGMAAGAGGLAGSGALAAGNGGVAGSLPTAGTGAAAGTGGTAAPSPVSDDSELTGSCGCRVPGERPSGGRSAVALVLLGLVGTTLLRRRRLRG